MFLQHSIASDWSPAPPLQNSSETADVGDNLKKLPAAKSIQGLKFHPNTEKKLFFLSQLPIIHRLQMLLGGKGRHLKYLILRQASGLQQHQKLNQHEVEPQKILHVTKNISVTQGTMYFLGKWEWNQLLLTWELK